MRISKLFNIFSAELIAQRASIFYSNYENQGKYLQSAKEISNCPNDAIHLVLERDADYNLRIAGVENSNDIFKTMDLKTLANLDSGDTNLNLSDAIQILEDYCYFKMP